MEILLKKERREVRKGLKAVKRMKMEEDSLEKKEKLLKAERSVKEARKRKKPLAEYVKKEKKWKLTERCKMRTRMLCYGK